MLEVTYTTDKKEVKNVVEYIDKQYYTVGQHLQNFLVSKKQEEGKELKTIRDFMDSQRAYVWETWRASNLIQTILLKNPIPEVTLYRHDDKSQFRKTNDGQQRLTTIYLFLNNAFKLDMSKTMFPEFKIEGETFKANESLQEKTFSELPELWQDIIKDYQLRITTMNNCSEEFAEKAFVQMNSGAKGLKASEIRKAAMGLGTRKFFRQVLESDWVLHALTLKSSLGNAGDEIISQMITLIHNINGIELSKDNIDNVIYSFRETGLPEETKENLINVCCYLNQVTEIWINNKKKNDEETGNKRVKNYNTYRYTWLNKTNTVMLMYSAYQAIKNNITVDEFQKWAFNFFQDPTGEYSEGLNGKVNELKLVQLRINGIKQEISKLNGYEEKQQQITDNDQDQEENQDQELEPSQQNIKNIENENEQEQKEDNNQDNNIVYENDLFQNQEEKPVQDPELDQELENDVVNNIENIISGVA